MVVVNFLFGSKRVDKRGAEEGYSRGVLGYWGILEGYWVIWVLGYCRGLLGDWGIGVM